MEDSFRFKDAPIETRHIAHIDGVRALAVAGVVMLHAWEYHGKVGNWQIDRIFAMGAHGVDLFFVVSGFCLAYPILRSVRSEDKAGFETSRFFAKRIVRIIPPYYAAIILLAIALPLLGLPTHGNEKPGEVLKQMLFLDRDISFLNRSFWTLPVEFRWYLAFPLLIYLYVRAPRVFLLLGCLSAVAYSFTRFGGIDFGTMPEFMLGIWAADLEILRSPLRRFAALTFVAAAALAFAFEPGAYATYYAVEPIGSIAAFCFVVAAGAFAPLRWILRWRPIASLGIISYSVYLVNDPVLEWTQTRLAFSPLAAIAIALIVATIFWCIFERPVTHTSLRESCIAPIQKLLDNLFAALSIPRRWQIQIQNPIKITPKELRATAPP